MSSMMAREGFQHISFHLVMRVKLQEWCHGFGKGENESMSSLEVHNFSLSGDQLVFETHTRRVFGG